MPIDQPRRRTSDAPARMTGLLDRADAAAARGDLVEACLMTRRADAIRAGDPLAEGGVEVRARLRWTMTDLAARSRDLDARTPRGRIAAALVRLGGCATALQVAGAVAERILIAEEARVQVLHMLGRELVISWPDHHPLHEVERELRAMALDGEARRVVPLAFWRGALWSPPLPGTGPLPPEPATTEETR